MALKPAGTDPNSQLLLDPADLVARLRGLSEDDAQRLAEEASAEVAGFFGYDLAYRQWEETFDIPCDTGAAFLPIYLTARPVAAVSEILDNAGNEAPADSWRADLTTARIYAPAGAPLNLLINWQLGGGGLLPQWSVFYSAGWWLPLQSGDKPDGVPLLDPAISRWAFSIARELQAQDGQRGKFQSFEVRGVKGTLRDPRQSASGYTVDPPAAVRRWKAVAL